MINETIFPSGYKTITIYNIPCTAIYGVYISQPLRFARACNWYSDFLARHKRLVRTLLDQSFRYGLLSKKNSNCFTGPTITCSSIIPTLWRNISGRVSIVRFGDGASAFCWLTQRLLAPTDYQFTLSLVSPWLFPPSFFYYWFSYNLYLFSFCFCFFFIFILLFFYFIYWCFSFFLSFIF